MLLISDYIALLACLILSVTLCFGVLHKSRWVNALCYTVAVAIFALHLGSARLEYIWVWLIPHPASTVVMLVAVWGPIIAILVGLRRYIKVERDRRAILIITLLVGLFGCWELGRQLIDPGAKKTALWQQATLIQSTGETCIAAATCTYLRTLAVELSEDEAVKLGLISTYGGSEVQSWRILRLALPDSYEVRIAPMTRENLEQTDHWYTTCIKWGFMTGHAIAVMADPDGGGVLVRDPLEGEYTLAWDEFEEKWLRVCVWAEKEIP